MPAPAWENLDDFLQTDEFAFAAVITLQAGGTIPLSVIFDDPSVEAGLEDAYTKDDVGPSAYCKEVLVGAVKRGDSIAITFPAPTGVKTYDILTAAKPDGTGMARLKLAVP